MKPRKNRADVRVSPTQGSSDVLRAVPEPHSSAIRAEYKKLGGRFSEWGNPQRRTMSEAIFAVENELEHQQANVRPSQRPVVDAMRSTRNRLLDELGENETH